MHRIFNEDYYLKCIRSEGYAEGMIAGIAEGKAESIAEGRLEERIAVTREFLKAGTPIDVISKATGFEPSYIQSLI